MKTHRRLAMLLLLLITMSATGCAYLKSRPEPDKQSTIEAAKALALAGCIVLHDQLDAEVSSKVDASLDAMAQVLARTTPLAAREDIAQIDPAIAPYAGAISAIAFAVMGKIPDDEVDTVYYEIIRAVVSGCGSARAGILANRNVG